MRLLARGLFVVFITSSVSAQESDSLVVQNPLDEIRTANQRQRAARIRNRRALSVVATCVRVRRPVLPAPDEPVLVGMRSQPEWRPSLARGPSIQR
jgi:hypothetical protein